MAEKHIFIGLGGSGVRTVSTLKYKIYANLEETRSESRLDQLNAKYRFIFVDTDNNDIDKANKNYENQFENGETELINAKSELLDLGNENPSTIFESFKRRPEYQINKRIVEACTGNVSARIFNHNLRDGAGAFRMASRIAFAQRIETFSSQLKSCIDDLNKIEDGAEANEVYYWVVSGSCGGTGCGILNDVLYYVNMTHKQKVTNEDPYVGLVLYMPQCYIEARYKQERYPKNGYATLSELQAFQVAARDEHSRMIFHRLALLLDYHQIDTSLSYRPFKYCIPVDLQTDKGTNMTDIPTMYSNTAEMLYYVHGGEGALSTRSDLSNNIDEACVGNPKAFLLPMGYIAMRKPEKELEDYLDARMRYELVKYGVLGNGVKDKENRSRLARELFKDIIVKNLLGGGKSGNSLFEQLKALVDNNIGDYFTDARIRENDVISNELPAGINNEAAEDIIRESRRAITDKSAIVMNNVLDRTEEDLWKWTEAMIMKHGVQYVLDVLFELDAHCPEYYNAYVERNISILATRQGQVDNIRGELDDLYQEAARITLPERLRKTNRDDVNAYFTKLQEYAEKQLYLFVAGEIHEAIKQLYIDESGRIDKIENYVKGLKESAFHRLTRKDNNLEEAYKKKLSKVFVDKKMDVTSVYLPSIDEFADGYGWKDRHLFSGLYGMIIKPGDEYEDGNGNIPVRNNNMLSLEQFFAAIKSENKDLLKKKGYVIGDYLCLFINSSLDDKEKILENLLDTASVTMRTVAGKNESITDFYAKSLAQLFEGLDRDKKKDIRDKMNPSLFFSYKKSESSQPLSEYKIYIAPTIEIAKEALNYTNKDGNSFFQESDDPKVMYVLRSNVGMTLDYYRTYDVIKCEYDKEKNKEEYHFHAAFAHAGGDISRIQLKKEFAPELVTFLKYLMMDGYKEILKDYYYTSKDAFDRDHYVNTPFKQEDGRALIATAKDFSPKNGIVCLTAKDIYNRDTFFSVVYSNSGAVYLTIYNKFKDNFVNDGLEKLIESIIREMNNVATSAFQVNYGRVYAGLIDKLNIEWENAENRDEKFFIAELLLAIKSELDTFDKFIR
jgi:hypothetical protein